MKETKGQPNEVSTCFDGSPSVEMMQKITGEARIGSLSEELMRSLIENVIEGVERSPIIQKKEK